MLNLDLGDWLPDTYLRPNWGVLLLTILFVSPPSAATLGQTALSEKASASLLTIWPGDRLYSIFGHTALRIQDPKQNLDVAYNYGTFDFDTPWFYVKFARGLLDYQLSKAQSSTLLRHYQALDRGVVEQHLNLNTTQVDSLYRFLEYNYRPANRYYQYDFFFDNCATRPWEAIARVARPNLELHPNPSAPTQSFREHLDPYLAHRPFVNLGIDLGLGAPADRVPTPREELFLPLELKESADQATVTTGGQPAPLVSKSDTLYWTTEEGLPPTTWNWPTLVLWLLFVGGIGAIYGNYSHGLKTKWIDRVNAFLFVIVGGMGIVIALLWFGTYHQVTGPNWNLLWAWPTHVMAGVALYRQTSDLWLTRYLMLTAGATFLVLPLWPLIPQTLPRPIVPLLLHVILQSAWVWRRKSNRPTG